MTSTPNTHLPRQTHYVALVLAPLAIVILACAYTIKLAVESDNAQLPIDLIKTGKALDHTPAQKAALEAFAGAQATLDRSSKRVVLVLPASTADHAALEARLVHPTLPERDVEIVLTPTPVGLEGSIPLAIPERGRLLVQSRAEGWVVETQYQLDAAGQAVVRFDRL